MNGRLHHEGHEGHEGGVNDPTKWIGDKFDQDAKPKVSTPKVSSFREFLLTQARVKTQSGEYAAYSFEGREALEFLVWVIDEVLGKSHHEGTKGEQSEAYASARGETAGAPREGTRPTTTAGTTGGHRPPLQADATKRVPPITDARLTATGSAQWGKTILELNLLAYLCGVEFRSAGLFLPDGDLVEGVVDSKFRPDVLDQQAWLNDLIVVGKAENLSGKTVNRKGLFTCTDGSRKSHVMIHGMQKIPTTFSFDVVIEDEKDDIPQDKSKYLTARMTASDLRFRLSIGTQRYAGAGQNLEFEKGTMHTGFFACPECGHKQNPEENFPAIVRLAVDGEPRVTDPQLQLEGNFKRGVHHEEHEGHEGEPRLASAATGERPAAHATSTADRVYEFEPEGLFYLGCVQCGTELNRRKPEFIAKHPEREKQHHWSVRISQLLVAAIELKQIVADWCNNAVRDPDAMKTFYVDRLGLPRSNSQGLDQKILDRSRNIEPSFDLSLKPEDGEVRFAGLDTGDRCWLTVRSVDGPRSTPAATAETTGGHRPPLQGGFKTKRMTWMEQLSAERVRARVPQVVEAAGVSCLFVDAGPLRDLARDLCFLLNGLVDFVPIKVGDPEKAIIHFPGGLVWDGRNEVWKGLKCAAVEFSLKEGKGIHHKLGITQDGLFYPIIACNRDETIERVVNELLTVEENVIEVVDGKARTVPSLRLPRRTAGSPKIIETYDAHVISGSRRERDDKGLAEHFVDGCENHFLLSTAYGALAETVGAIGSQTSSGGFRTVKAFRTGKLAVAG
jgi:hypothetical protein